MTANWEFCSGESNKKITDMSHTIGRKKQEYIQNDH